MTDACFVYRNVGHLDDDIYNKDAPHTKKQCGLTPEERASWSETLSTCGLVDTFRAFHPNATGWYSYWSGRAGNKPKNRGLRLDYFAASERMMGVKTGRKPGRSRLWIRSYWISWWRRRRITRRWESPSRFSSGSKRCTIKKLTLVQKSPLVPSSSRARQLPVLTRVHQRFLHVPFRQTANVVVVVVHADRSDQRFTRRRAPEAVSVDRFPRPSRRRLPTALG